MLKLAQDRNIELEKKAATLEAECSFGFNAASEMLFENESLASAVKDATKAAALQQLKMILSHMHKGDMGLCLTVWRLNAVEYQRNRDDFLLQVNTSVVAIDTEIASLTIRVNDRIESLPEPATLDPSVDDQTAALEEQSSSVEATPTTVAAHVSQEAVSAPSAPPKVEAQEEEYPSVAASTSTAPEVVEPTSPPLNSTPRSGRGRFGGAPVMSPGAAAYLRRIKPIQFPAAAAPDIAPTIAPSLDLAQVKAVIHDATRELPSSDQVDQVAALPNTIFVDALADVPFEEQKRLRQLLRSERKRHAGLSSPPPIAATE